LGNSSILENCINYLKARETANF